MSRTDKEEWKMQTNENQPDNVTTLLVTPKQVVLLESLQQETNHFDNDSQLNKTIYQLKISCTSKEFYQVLKRLIKLARWYKNPRIIDVIDAKRLKDANKQKEISNRINNDIVEVYKGIIEETEQLMAKEQEAEVLKEISDTSFCSDSYANFSSKIFPKTRV